MNMMEEFIEDRNEALLSLNKEHLLAFMRKWEISFPCSTESVWWAAVHKARLSVPSFSEEVKEISRNWLLTHEFKVAGYSGGAMEVEPCPK